MYNECKWDKLLKDVHSIKEEIFAILTETPIPNVTGNKKIDTSDCKIETQKQGCSEKELGK